MSVHSRRTGWAALLTVLLCVAGALVAFVGVQSGGEPAPAGTEGRVNASPGAGPVYTIALPTDEPLVPPGPNRRVFQTSCTVCHSTRLPLNQPPLTEKQWTEVVAKMVKVYGAAVTPEQQREIVAYLTALPAPPRTAAVEGEAGRPALAKR